MKAMLATTIFISLLLLGCYSTPMLGEGEAPVITTSKNFTMKEGWQESFKLVVGDSTTTHKIFVSSVAARAATLKIDGKSFTLTPGQTEQILLKGGTVFLTLNNIEEGYAKFTISLSREQAPTSSVGKKQNGAVCFANSDCQSNYCSNGYCCSSGMCCVSDANCSVGKCNTTIFSCFTPALLSDGSPCNSNSDCQSNHCSNGYCCVSGKCCLSNSDCSSGEICNTTIHSCVQTSIYTALAAEEKANSTEQGKLIGRFSALFETARECPGGSSAYKQCIPYISIRSNKLSSSRFKVTYSYTFNGTSCCPTSDVLEITVDLSTNATTYQWKDTTITSALADNMNSSLQTNCVSAIQYIACKSG
ncbi:MAG: hypothetical protein QXF56_05880 [Candidatus Micrarchaeia archaeon]